MSGKAAKTTTPPTRDEGKSSRAALCIFAVLFWGGFLSSAHMTFRESEKPLLLLQLLMCAD